MLAAWVEEKDAGAETSMRAALSIGYKHKNNSRTVAAAGTAFRHAKPNK